MRAPVQTAPMQPDRNTPETIVLGIETLFRMAFVAVSLVAGLLLSNVVLPARRDLARTTGGGSKA